MAYASLIDCIFSKYSENQTVSVIDKNDQAIKQLLQSGNNFISELIDHLNQNIFVQAIPFGVF